MTEEQSADGLSLEDAARTAMENPLGAFDPLKRAEQASDWLGKYNPWFYVVSWAIAQLASIIAAATAENGTVIILSICAILANLFVELWSLSNMFLLKDHTLCCCCFGGYHIPDEEWHESNARVACWILCYPIE